MTRGCGQRAGPTPARPAPTIRTARRRRGCWTTREASSLICRTLPGKRYAVWFNRPPLDDFSSFGRRPATPFELKFATTDDEPVRTLTEAMKADPALSALGNPVEPDGLATYGQSEPPGAP